MPKVNTSETPDSIPSLERFGLQELDLSNLRIRKNVDSNAGVTDENIGWDMSNEGS